MRIYIYIFGYANVSNIFLGMTDMPDIGAGGNQQMLEPSLPSKKN